MNSVKLGMMDDRAPTLTTQEGIAAARVGRTEAATAEKTCRS
jgi:hypothetical protein